VEYGLGVLSTTVSFVAHKWGLHRISRFDPEGKKIRNYYSPVAQRP
jgi:hypothetical protein